MANSGPEILNLSAVGKIYKNGAGSIAALKDIDLSLAPAQTMALVGPSGCGKSTLLLLMAGLERPTAGRIMYEGKPLDKVNQRIALVLQDYGLFPWMTVRKNVELGLKIRGQTECNKDVEAVLSELQIADKADLYPQQLSGGQKQRVALARALVLKPALLLLDEPFAALDTLTRERLQDLVIELWNARSFALVIATHNIPEAVHLGQKVLVMGNAPGQILSNLDNPAAGLKNGRLSDEFTRAAKTLREQLKAVA